MTTIDISQLQKLAPHMAQSYRASWTAADVADILARYGISKDPLRVSHFLAQTLVESGRLQDTVEDLNYSAARMVKVWPKRFRTVADAQPYANNPEKLGNFVYGGRKDLGNTQDGDGYKYRGRGLLQITGRAAYRKYGNQLGIPLEDDPDLVLDPAHCLEVAAAEWAASGYKGRFCNDLADLDDVYGVTRAINGGLTDIDARIAALKQCKAVWLAGAPATAPAIASAAQARAMDEAAADLPAGLAVEDKFGPHAYVKTGAAPAAGLVQAREAPIADDLRAPAPYFKRPDKTFGPRIAGAAGPWDIGDLCKAYNWPSGLQGGGKIAIVELDGGWTESDMQDFFARNSLPYPNIVDVPVSGYPGAGNNPNQHIGDPADPDIEVGMDIEVAAAAYSLATGKAADVRVYWSGKSPGGIADAVAQAAADGCDVCSISWGADEARWQLWSTEQHHYLLEMEATAQDAVAKGMIVFAASGDNDSKDGGDDPANVDAPSSCPSVVGCGGTTKTKATEIVWNDTPGQTDGDGTGGGFSRYFQRPAWQASAPPDNLNNNDLTHRMVPDVAANADPNTGYNLVIHGQPAPYGGTSAVAPLYAGLFAAFGPKLGSVSQRLWANANSFTNITQGGNGAYNALNGPDACTGLGVPIGTKLAGLFAPAAVQQPVAQVATPFGARAASGGPQAFDPLAAVQYGLLIDAAYSMYDAQKANPTPTPPPQPDFPTGFRLVAWVQMNDFIILDTGPQFYGFIAQSVSDPTKFVLALRGTEDPTEWFDNVTSIVKVPFRVPGCGSVSFGFNRIYDTMEIIEAAAPAPGAAARAAGSLKQAGRGFSKQMAALVQKHAPAQARAIGAAPQFASIDVTAHSLGGALATLYVLENAKDDKIPNQVLYTFGSPMVGDATFAAAFNALGLTSWRIVNKQDLVPQLPSEFLGYQHIAVEQAYDSTGLVQANPSCWHAMATYLALIDRTRQPDPNCQIQAVAAAPAFVAARAAAPAPLATPAIDTNTNVTTYLPSLAAAGVTAVGRYYSIYASKVLTQTEAEAITNAGLSIFTVYEDGADPAKFNAGLGTFQAQQALICARDVGQPQGSAIYFAIDFDCTATQFQQQITPYFNAVNAVFAGQGFPYKIGVYGSGLVCQGLLAAGLCSYTWLTNSKGFQGYQQFYASKRWNLAQHLPKYYGKLQADPNETAADFGAFQVGAAPAFAAACAAAPAVTPAGPTPWMDWMRAHRGEIQQTGAKPTPFTIEIFQHTNYPPLQGYTPPSCAATVCAALELTGYKSTHDAAAVSYRDYGDPCELKPGCIVVYQWPNKDHHVDFCDAIIDADTVRGLGGNQGSQLKDSDYSRRYIVATRWPIPADGDFPIGA